MAREVVRIEYMCTHCGARMERAASAGRPDPGVCPRRIRPGMPHRWVVNKKSYAGPSTEELRKKFPNVFRELGL